MSLKTVQVTFEKASKDSVTEWVKQSQSGNLRTFELLYREFHQQLFLFCKRMTSDPSVSEELVQESFIKAWLALPQFRAESGFYTWLRKIASHLVIDRFRLNREKIWQNVTDLNDADFIQKTQLDSQLDLEKLIALLPQGARSVFILHEIEGYAHREIATLLTIAEGTSKAQLARAKTLLRNSYNKQPIVTAVSELK